MGRGTRDGNCDLVRYKRYSESIIVTTQFCNHQQLLGPRGCLQRAKHQSNQNMLLDVKYNFSWYVLVSLGFELELFLLQNS